MYIMLNLSKEDHVEDTTLMRYESNHT